MPGVWREIGQPDACALKTILETHTPAANQNVPRMMIVHLVEHARYIRTQVDIFFYTYII